MSSRQLYAVRVFTHRWERALAFYRDTLDLPLSYEDGELGWAQFDLGGTYLALEQCDPAEQEAKSLVGRFVGVSIAVENIQMEYETLLARGVVFTSPPTTQSWGGVLAHFKDLDENILTFLESPADRESP